MSVKSLGIPVLDAPESPRADKPTNGTKRSCLLGHNRRQMIYERNDGKRVTTQDTRGAVSSRDPLDWDLRGGSWRIPP